MKVCEYRLQHASRCCAGGGGSIRAAPSCRRPPIPMSYGGIEAWRPGIDGHILKSQLHNRRIGDCISLLHIFTAYLYCISLCRVAVFCCLGVGSIFGRFGGVFVRFLVVLGGLRGVLEALLEVLVSPYLHCRPWVNSPPFPSTPLFRTLTLPNFTQLNLT